MPRSCRKLAIVKNPNGYISNTVEEGTMSLTGPYRIAFSRKS
jgi:hypothetical protein